MNEPELKTKDHELLTSPEMWCQESPAKDWIVANSAGRILFETGKAASRLKTGG